MFLQNTRYRKAKLFQAAPHQSAVFGGIRPREIGPTPGVVEHRVKEGDRLDLLARHYYNDDRLWWRILDANPQLLFGGELLPVAGQVAGRWPDADHHLSLTVIEVPDSEQVPGWYVYRTTFFDGRGNEWPAAADTPSTRVSVTATVPHPAVTLTDFPAPPDDARFIAQGRRVYRSHDGGPFLLLDEESDLTSSEFTDATSPEAIADHPQPFDVGRDQPQFDNWVGRVILIPKAQE